MPFKRAAELVGNAPRKIRRTADFAGFFDGIEWNPLYSIIKSLLRHSNT
jgi:hypothetical protein